jgi:hypothetical protein
MLLGGVTFNCKAFEELEMDYFSKRALFGILVTALVSTACAGSGGGAPSAALPVAAGVQAGSDASTPNIGGQYVGTSQDSFSGKGHVTGSFAQRKSTAGGWLSFAYSNLTFRTSTVTAVSGTSVSSVSVATIDNVACTFNVTGKYDSSKNQLTGSYKAVHGCTGDHGTYTLKQKCYYVQAEDVRPEIGGKPC